MKIVIIGGGASGCSLATRLRRLNEEVEITILERTNEISIANCGLPYYVSNVINDRNQILVSTKEKFKSWFNINVKLNSNVIEINTKEKFVTLENEEKIFYDKLVLSTGAKPIIPEIDGINRKNIFTIKTLFNTDKLKEYIKINNPKKAIILGGGFIGLEMAENLHKLGLEVKLIELGKQIMPPVDIEIAQIIQNKLIANNIDLLLEEKIQKIENDKIILESQKEITYDIIILAIGFSPEIELAKQAGIKTNRGIIVNEFMETSDKDIYAGGDNIEIKDFVTNDNTLIPLAGPANRQGRIIADNILGLKSIYKNSLGSSVIQILDSTVACVGNNEKQLQRKNISYWKTYIFGKNHASYYPNSKQNLFKLLFASNGKILGAQAIGEKGIEKRIDTISSIMRGNGTIQEMIDSEFCYAPPYASAKETINILGMNAENIIRGLVKPAYFEDLKTSILIDVRPKIIYEANSIKNAINIPINEIRSRIDEIPKDKKVVLFCNTGYTSYCASRILIQKGYSNVYSFMGGFELYKLLNPNYNKIKTII